MISGLLLFLIPTTLFVLAFLYETFLSFVRLRNPKVSKKGYLSATWEVTHTLLVFAVVMLVMMFTKSLDKLSSEIFMSTLLAALILAIRGVLYTHIFYVRSAKKINWLDWSFALSHVIAALLLVITVIKAVVFVVTEKPEANTQFVPFFIPGLVIVLGICVIPLLTLYRTKS